MEEEEEEDVRVSWSWRRDPRTLIILVLTGRGKVRESVEWRHWEERGRRDGGEIRIGLGLDDDSSS